MDVTVEQQQDQPGAALSPTLSRKREREIRSDPLAPRSGERVRERGRPVKS